MRKQLYISLLAAILALPLLIKAQDASMDSIGAPENLLIFGEEEEERSASSRQATSLSEVSSDDPDWYVEPVIPDSLKAPFGAPRSSVRGFGEEEAERSASISKADSRSGVSADDRSPMRTAAAACLTDSILTFNQDSVLTEATTYDYDAAGRTIRTTVWQYNADGSRTGKSKQEYAFDASGTQIYTGTFAWDAATNDWKGTSKSEYVYNEAHKMESNITYTWVNNTWLPSQALTYAYDAAGRETEFTTYARNASLNRLVPSKQLIYEWYNSSKKTLEIQYTAYTNGAWSAGTKKVYDYDASGNQILYDYYSAYSNGTWTPSTHEEWVYLNASKKLYYEKRTYSSNAWSNTQKEIWEYDGAGRQTLHEKYNGSSATWTINLREIKGYDAAGNNTLVENYSLSGSTWKGTKKEEYTFNSGKKKILTIVYKWSNNDWVYNTKTEADYSGSNQTLNAKYNWTNGAWVGSGTRTETVYVSGKKSVVYSLTWDASTTDWVYSTRQSFLYSGSKTIGDTTKHYVNSEWVNYSLTTHAFDAKGNDTLAITSSWDGSDWTPTSINKGTYTYTSSGKPLLIETYTGLENEWTGNQKIEYTYDVADRQTSYCLYEWRNGSWANKSRSEQAYDDAGHQILSQGFNWSNNTWVGSFKYEYEYDANGREIVQAQYSWSSNQWYGLSRTERSYYESGKVAYTISFTWATNAWANRSKTEYIYDNQGHTTDKKTYMFSNNQWENNRWSTYVFNSTGAEVSSWEYYWSVSQWLPVSQHDRIYDQTDNKLRQEIVGAWTNGILQSFTDLHYFYSCDAPTNNNGSQPRTPTGTEEDAEFTERILDNNNENTLITSQPMYNLQGQPIDPTTYHGIVIQNGKKYVL